MHEGICFLEAHEMAAMIPRREVTAVALAEAHLARVDSWRLTLTRCWPMPRLRVVDLDRVQTVSLSSVCRLLSRTKAQQEDIEPHMDARR